MVDWLSSMQQTFEYYTVDPGTWKDDKPLTNVKSCTINRDADADTLGSASFDITDSLGECYIRVYLVTIQNGVKERHPLGTYLIQTPSSSFDGKYRAVSVDAYTPLLELKESPPPIGYFTPELDDNGKPTVIMDAAYVLVREHARAPVIKPATVSTEDPEYNNRILHYDFVANTDDTWITFIKDLIATAKHTFALDETGRILFSPKQDTASLQPVWTFDDGDKSILYHDITMNHDLYGIPNVVEVVYSSGRNYFHARVVNDDPNSPISTVNRGREIIYRETNPSSMGNPTQLMIEEYATQLLRDLSTVEYSISYSHAYCPVRIGDCVRINYARAGLTDVKAKVISQSIKCEPGCPVSEKDIFTTKLWG